MGAPNIISLLANILKNDTAKSGGLLYNTDKKEW